LYIKFLGVVLSLAGLYIAVNIHRVDKTVARLFAVSLGVGVMPCVLYITNQAIPDRYLVYAVPLLLLAIAKLLRRLPRRFVCMSILVVLMVALRWPPALNGRGLEALTHPMESFASLQRTADAPYAVLAFLPQKRAVLLNKNTSNKKFNNIFDVVSLLYLVLDAPVILALPDYADFIQGKNNALIDGIVFRNAAAEWAASPVLIDHAGVRFEQIAGPLFDGCNVFRRVP
jgi:hypothetical protein